MADTQQADEDANYAKQAATDANQTAAADDRAAADAHNADAKEEEKN